MSDHLHKGVFRSIEEVDALIDRIDELEGQLPDEMQDCTIVFEPCDKGHGTLRGTNWLKVDCPYCRIDELTYLVTELDAHEGAEGWSKYLEDRLVEWRR
jgi:hypothetical protein